jgi:hypothetical protein
MTLPDSGAGIGPGILPGKTEPVFVVPICSVVPVAVRRAEIPVIVIVPGPAAKNTTTTLLAQPPESKVPLFQKNSAFLPARDYPAGPKKLKEKKCKG